LPIVLWVTMSFFFKFSTQRFGKDRGYLLGFACYWLLWGLLIPALWVGAGNFPNFLKDQTALFSAHNLPAVLLWVVVIAVAFIMYGKNFIKAPLTLILLAIPLAMINGFCEEILWRGLYVSAFPGNPWLGILYPAAGFALWHFIPQRVFPSENVPRFVLSTLFLGLAYGFIAYSTGSAFWTAVSHSLNGIIALGGVHVAVVLRVVPHRTHADPK